MRKALLIFISVFAILIAPTSDAQESVGEDVKYCVLAITYIGESDKPTPAVVISDSEAGAEWYRRVILKRHKVFTYEHVVNTALLETLIAEAESFERAVRPELEKIPESGGTVSVTIITPEKKSTFLYYPESAISQVDSLLKHCKGDESLHSDLLKFQDRIRPR